jgi:hypothetical protein
MIPKGSASIFVSQCRKVAANAPIRFSSSFWSGTSACLELTALSLQGGLRGASFARTGTGTAMAALRIGTPKSRMP